MRVALVGGAGFVGSHLVDQLTLAGHQPVIVDIRVSKWHPKVPTYVCGIDDDVLLANALKDCDALVHLAAVSNTRLAFLDPKGCYQVNVIGTQRVLAAAKHVGIGKVIVAGSSLVSGAQVSHGGVVTEADPFHLNGVQHPYVASKIAAEMVASTFRLTFGLPVLVFRYGIMYGPRMAPGVVAHSFITNALEGRPLMVHGTGLQWRQYLHVSDLVRAHVMALESAQWPDLGNMTMNIVGPDQVTIEQMATTVAELTDGNIVYDEARPDDIEVGYCSPRKAANTLGWATEIQLRDGLEQTVDWYRKNG